MALTPQRNENGEVIPHNHPEILPNHWVIRRISELWVVKEDDGRRRLSSMAFKASSGVNAGMSVDLHHEIEQAGLDAQKYVTTPRWIASIRLQVGPLREEDFLVGADPIDGDKVAGIPPNPHHGEVWGRFTKAKQGRLRELCEWFVPMPDVLIQYR